MSTHPSELSRRRFLAGLSGLFGAATLAACTGGVIDRAYRADPSGTGSLADIDHFVLLMLENRSFDHYFGTLSSVRGFDDLNPAQRALPFHLDSRSGLGADTDILSDPGHSWDVQHASWNNGAMDGWAAAHRASDGTAHAAEVMGYYTRADLPTHYALADAFTVCDNYFSSVLGPTAPNRMYWMTGTADPTGAGGGPVLGESATVPRHSLTWRTFGENLLDAGVSWKVYNAHPPSYVSELSGMLKYFAAYQDSGSQLYRCGLAPRLADFHVDVASGQLPAVSWLIPPLAVSEHPSFPPAVGAEQIMRVLDTLTRNPAVWERSALIVSYDENGGFFDHVAPPTPPAGAVGEFITGHTVPSATGPIGLGFRVPCLVISPYTRGARLSSDVADHTSQLRLVGRRFDVPVPNLTTWRSATVSDLTDAFQTRERDGTMPSYASTVAAATEARVGDARVVATAQAGNGPPILAPSDSTPRQEQAPIRTQT